jgi:GNAT superfamily N-acetyltransferase
MLITDVQTLPNIPNAVEAIVSIQEKYFVQRLGWGAAFKEDIREYLEELLQHESPTRDGLWVAIKGEEIIGSIAIDGRVDGPECARLRVFIVDYNYHRLGIGKSLLNQAIAFCRKMGYKKIELWTFDNLYEAKALYFKYGFRIIKERDVKYWGCQLREQLFGFELFPKKNGR